MKRSPLNGIPKNRGLPLFFHISFRYAKWALIRLVAVFLMTLGTQAFALTPSASPSHSSEQLPKISSIGERNWEALIQKNSKIMEQLENQSEMIQTGINRVDRASLRVLIFFLALVLINILCLLMLQWPQRVKAFVKAAQGHAIAFFVALVLFEVIGNMSGLVPTESYFWQLNVRNYDGRHVQNSSYDVKVTTNAQGIRAAQPIAVKKPGDTFRIVLVGDSMTFGYGVNDDETQSSYLRELLPNVSGGKRIEIINLGVPGTGVPQYHRSITRYAEELGADLVVVNMTMTNDTHQETPGRVWRNNIETRKWLSVIKRQSKEDDDDVEKTWKESPFWRSVYVRLGVRTYQRKFYDIDLSTYRTQWAGPETGIVSRSGDEEDPKVMCRRYLKTTDLCKPNFVDHLPMKESREAYMSFVENGSLKKACSCSGQDPFWIEQAIRQPNSFRDIMMLREETHASMYSHFNAVVLALLEMRKTANQYKAKFVAGFLPHGWMVDETTVGENYKGNIWTKDMLKTTREPDFFEKRCREEGLTCVSPIGEFRARVDEKLYLPNDYHFSARGQRLYAEILAKTLRPMLPK